MKVTNLTDTGDLSCSCGSWLAHWERFNSAGQQKPYWCPACGLNHTEVGAHVQKYKSTDKKWYIVPLCKGCNNQSSDKVLDIGDCALAPENTAATCRR